MEYLNIHGRGEWIHESYNSAIDLVNDIPDPKYLQLLGMGIKKVFEFPLMEKGAPTGPNAHDSDLVQERCLYLFNRGGRELREFLGCVDDVEFVGTIVKAYHPPRRRLSDSPRVRVESIASADYLMAIECSQEPFSVRRKFEICPQY